MQFGLSECNRVSAISSDILVLLFVAPDHVLHIDILFSLLWYYGHFKNISLVDLGPGPSCSKRG